MKNFFYKIIVSVVSLLAFQSCLKDLGNYDYSGAINEAIVSNLDTFYVRNKDEILTINPVVTYTHDKIGRDENYKFEWIWYSLQGFMPQNKVVGVGKSAAIDLSKQNMYGQYEYRFRVTDKATGIFKEFPFKVLVRNNFYEGWLVLSEVNNNQSRLDMLRYEALSSDYTFIGDALTTANSQLKLSGMPLYVKFFNIDHGAHVPNTNGSGEGILLGTSILSTYVGADTLNYKSFYEFKNYYSGDSKGYLGLDAKMEDVIYMHAAMYSNGIVSLVDKSIFGAKFMPISNRISNGKTIPFKASQFISLGSGYFPDVILFDEDASEFVWYPLRNNPCIQLDNGKLFNNKIDKDLLYMRYVSYDGGTTFAILKDKAQENVYLARFRVNEQISFGEIFGTQINLADHFEISDDYGYIFYTVANKLYQYDIMLNQNKMMVDFGNKKISNIRFNRSIPAHLKNARYDELSKKLIVTTYEDGNLDSSGEMHFYSVPPRGEQIVKESTYSGFGKIKDFTYRAR